MPRLLQRRAILCALSLWLVGATTQACAAIACMDRGGDALPADAYPVPVSRSRELQQLLDEHGRVRLDPAGDYRKAGTLTLRSDQAMFGVAGARVARLVVAPGTSGSIVSGIIPDALEFPPSALRTHDNCFERFAARSTPQQALVLRNAVVENNLFLDVGQVIVDTTIGGSVRNNRFIRTMVHGHSPAVQLLGRGATGADRNVFLWTNLLSAPGEAILVRGQRQANFVGLDAEDWNRNRLARNPSMLAATETETLRVFMAQGGDSKRAPDAYMDMDAGRVDLIGLVLYQAAQPAIRIRQGVKQFSSLLASSSRLIDESKDAAGWTAFADFTDRVDVRAAAAPAAVAGSPTAWNPPVFQPVPDPAGPDWRRRRLSARDSAPELQRLIDAQGIARLPPGVFFIASSLRLKSGQGIVGSGSGRTVIVAMSDDIDILVADDHVASPRPLSWVLADLALQGGRSGIRHDARGAGAGAQFVHTQLSHLVFSDMAQAGIVVDGIYGWDNNLLDDIAFLRMPVGIQQKPNPAYESAERSGNIAGANYMDKNLCYRCRFEDTGTGLELIAKRANNLNACVDCRFVRNRRSAVRLQYNGSTVLANCDFIGNGGDPVISSDQPVGVVGSRFVAGNAATMLGPQAVCESCRFEGSGSDVRIAARGARVFIVNSHSSGMPLGSHVSGLLADSIIPGVEPARLLGMSDGRHRVLVPGPPQPAEGLLVDWPP